MRIRLLYRKQINSAVDANEDHIRQPLIANFLQVQTQQRSLAAQGRCVILVCGPASLPPHNSAIIYNSCFYRIYIKYKIKVWIRLLMEKHVVIIIISGSRSKKRKQKKSEWIVLIVYWSQPPGGDQYARPHFWESLYIVVCSDFINLTRFNSSSI